MRKDQEKVFPNIHRKVQHVYIMCDHKDHPHTLFCIKGLEALPSESQGISCNYGKEWEVAERFRFSARNSNGYWKYRLLHCTEDTTIASTLRRGLKAWRGAVRASCYAGFLISSCALHPHFPPPAPPKLPKLISYIKYLFAWNAWYQAIKQDAQPSRWSTQWGNVLQAASFKSPVAISLPRIHTGNTSVHNHTTKFLIELHERSNLLRNSQ